MRFLLDECVSPLVKQQLLGSGHDVVHVHDVGLTSAPDSEVLEAAAAEERVVVTMDTDFGALVAHSGSRLPSVMLFRGEVTRRPNAQAALLLANLDQVAHDLDEGAVVVQSEGSKWEGLRRSGASPRRRSQLTVRY